MKYYLKDINELIGASNSFLFSSAVCSSFLVASIAVGALTSTIKNNFKINEFNEMVNENSFSLCESVDCKTSSSSLYSFIVKDEINFGDTLKFYSPWVVYNDNFFNVNCDQLVREVITYDLSPLVNSSLTSSDIVNLFESDSYFNIFKLLDEPITTLEFKNFENYPYESDVTAKLFLGDDEKKLKFNPLVNYDYIKDEYDKLDSQLDFFYSPEVLSILIIISYASISCIKNFLLSMCIMQFAELRKACRALISNLDNNADNFFYATLDNVVLLENLGFIDEKSRNSEIDDINEYILYLRDELEYVLDCINNTNAPLKICDYNKIKKI